MSKPISFWRQEIKRIRPGTKTSRGSNVPDWDNTDELTISNCCVQPSDTALSQDGRVIAISEGLTAYLPKDSDVLEGDRIEYDNETYTIDGAPQKRISATGKLDHVQLRLVRWTG